MADSNIIFTLEAVDENARRVCLDARNTIWNPQPSWLSDEGDSTFSSREPTPMYFEPLTRPQLRFTFSDKPKNTSKGFTFGSDERSCDVVIGKKRNGISGCHFYITIDAGGRVIVKDISTRGTRVKYDGQGDFLRTKFQWIVFPEYKKIIIITGESITKTRFEIHVTEHNPYDLKRRALLDSYLRKSRTTLPLDLMQIQSQETTAQPSREDSSRSGHIYIKEDLLGMGAFGKVYSVKDVSTGNRYAGKEFHTFLHDWKQEIKILEKLSHDHIVRFIAFLEEAEPMLIMEFLPLGNLAAQHNDVPLSDQDSVILCYQLLQALEYIHFLNITHRDIKPLNILVKSRKPFHVQLADFGLAKDGSALFTHCGTDLYTAPEVYDRKGYTSTADIWSVGVVVFEFAYGIPGRFVTALQGKACCSGIVAALEDCELDSFLELLSKLLQLNYQNRLTASGSLKELNRLNLLGEGSFNFGDHGFIEEDAVTGVDFASNSYVDLPLPSLSQLPAPQLSHPTSILPVPERQQHTQNRPLGFNEYAYSGQLFRECLHNSRIVRLRVGDNWICFTSMAEAAGRSMQWVSGILSRVASDSIKSYNHKGQKRRGTLMEPSLGMTYARDLGVSELMDWLLATHTDENMVFSVRGYNIWVLPSRQMINAAQLAIAAGFTRADMQRALKRLEITLSEYNRCHTKRATGTYVNFDDGLKLWRHFGLEHWPLAQFMEDHTSHDLIPETKCRLDWCKGVDDDTLLDREERNEENKEEALGVRQYDNVVEAVLENEDGKQDGQGEPWGEQTAYQRDSSPRILPGARSQQNSQHSYSSVQKWYLGTSQLDRLSHHTASGQKLPHRPDDSFDDMAVLFPGVSDSIVDKGK